MRILFHKGRGISASFIRHFTRSDSTHVSILFDDGILFEARPGGVRKTLLTNLKDVTAYRVTVPVDTVAVRKFCEEQVEQRTGYDYAGVLGFVLGLRQHLGRWANRLVCSEFIFAAVAAGGVALLSRTEPWEVSPAILEKSSLLEPVPIRGFDE